MKKLLLSTLGESPAVVTEAIDKLRDLGTEITHISLLTTKDEDACKTLELLYKHIPRYYQGRIQFYSKDVIGTYQDIDTDEAAVEFLEKACPVLKCLKSGWEVHVCIAGGRKAMSALLTLAVQFFGATSLFHIVVDDPKIEEMGHISKLYNLPEEELKQYLHPPPDKIKLVKLPFIGLFPLMDRIISTLQGKGEKDPEIESLLEQNKLLQNGKITELGRTVLGILEQAEFAPKARSGGCKIHINKKEPKERRILEEYANKLSDLYFVEEIISIPWSPGRPRVEKGPPNCRKGEKGPPNCLEVYLPGEKVQNVGLCLKTTAETDGQLEFAKERTEKLLKELLKV